MKSDSTIGKADRRRKKYLDAYGLPKWLVKRELAAGKELSAIYAEHSVAGKRKRVQDAAMSKKPETKKRAPRKRGKNSREKVCAFRMTDSEFAAVEAALAKINPKPGVEDGPAYAPADFYRAAALALLADAGSQRKPDIQLVREWLAEARK